MYHTQNAGNLQDTDIAEDFVALPQNSYSGHGLVAFSQNPTLLSIFHNGHWDLQCGLA